jgi:Cellulose binding domain
MNGRKMFAAALLAILLVPAPVQAQGAAAAQPAVPDLTSTTAVNSRPATLTLASSQWTCTVRFSAWNGFFTASGTLGWSGPSPTPGWVVTFVLPPNMSVTQVWSASYSQSGTNVRLASPSWGGLVPLAFGFNGRYTGTFTPPSDMQVNGVPCTVIVN